MCERERHTDRQTDRPTDGQTERQTDGPERGSGTNICCAGATVGVDVVGEEMNGNEDNRHGGHIKTSGFVERVLLSLRSGQRNIHRKRCTHMSGLVSIHLLARQLPAASKTQDRDREREPTRS